MENIGKFKTALSDIGKALENEFDYDFSINEKFIGTVSEFDQLIKKPFEANKQKIFYRGERINDLSRPLVPTLLRNKKKLLEKQKEGKKRMRQVGSVQVPSEAFMAVLKI